MSCNSRHSRKIAGRDARRIELLHASPSACWARANVLGAAVGIDQVFEPALQVAVGVEVVDDPVAHLPQRLVEIEPAKLIVQIVLQRLRTIDHVGHRVVLAVAFFVDASGRGAAALLEVVGPLLVHVAAAARNRPRCSSFRRRPARALRASERRDSELLDFFLGQIGIFLDQFERLVFLHLLLDALLQGHDRQLQDFHRLDHARRQHLLLNEPQFLSEGKSHGVTLVLVLCGARWQAHLFGRLRFVCNSDVRGPKIEPDPGLKLLSADEGVAQGFPCWQILARCRS